MSLTQARVEFAAEFVTLVVVVSALALLVLRPAGAASGRSIGPASNQLGLTLRSLVSAVALVVIGAACFAHGSLLVTGDPLRWVGAGRLAAGLIALAAFPYPGGPRTGRPPIGGVLLRLGFLCWAAAGAVELGKGQPYATDALLFAGSLVVAAALVRVSRRSIAVRVATSGAATLLLVVIVVALSLSTVISSSVQKQELDDLANRAAVEKAALTDTSSVTAGAKTVQVYLTRSFPQADANPLALFAMGTPAQQASAAQAIAAAIDELPPPPATGTIAYTSPDGRRILVAGDDRVVAGPGFASAPALSADCRAGQQGLFVLGGILWLAASSPECTPSSTLLGVAVAAQPLDASYLAGRAAIERGAGLALVSGRTVLARAGLSPGTALAAVAATRPGDGQSVTQPLGSGFASVTGLSVSTSTASRQPLDLVVDDTSSSVVADRNQLFRTLFLIAFGGTILALGLAVFTGDRITARLRRLTGVAAAVAGGDSTMRAAVAGEDEVAALGQAFDAMIDSVSSQSTALQAAAEDEARLRNRLQAVVAGMSDGLVAVDTTGAVTEFNRAAVELTGVSAQAAVGAPVERVLRLHTEEGLPVGPQLLQPGGRTAAMLARLVRDGAEIPVAVSAGGLSGPNGEAAGRVLVIRDMRREEEVEQMKTQFLSRIGHELRTPLTGILGYADILLRRPVREEMARAWYEDILHSARRLLRIVEMLEFFASEGAGRVVLQPEPVDVRALVSGIASSWTGRVPDNLTIGRRVPRGETVVQADPRWLTLAIDELVDNAVKFSPEGGRILLRVTRDAGTINIEVADQGMGMTVQHRDVIFGDFVQGDPSDTRRFGGLGLGLAVVRRVVEGHGGTVACRSAPGRGTTFVIGLPAVGDAVPAGNGSTADPATPAKRRAARTSKAKAR